MMSDNKTGKMVWLDLTVKDAVKVKDFYQHVIGWQAQPVPMNNGEYNDFAMNASDEECVSGICHATGGNADMPAAWLPYFSVADLDESINQVVQQGGELLGKVKTMGADRYVVIKDPAGAMCVLYQKA